MGMYNGLTGCSIKYIMLMVKIIFLYEKVMKE